MTFSRLTIAIRKKTPARLFQHLVNRDARLSFGWHRCLLGVPLLLQTRSRTRWIFGLEVRNTHALPQSGRLRIQLATIRVAPPERQRNLYFDLIRSEKCLDDAACWISITVSDIWCREEYRRDIFAPSRQNSSRDKIVRKLRQDLLPAPRSTKNSVEPKPIPCQLKTPSNACFAIFKARRDFR